MLQLSRLSRIFQLQIKSSHKNEWTMVLWSRSYSSNAGPMKLLHQKIDSGELKLDEYQTKVMNELQTLYDTIKTYTPVEIQSKSSLLKWLPIKSKKPEKNNAPKGLYICGSVGGGKTTLMDIFYNSCQTVNCVCLERNKKKTKINSLNFMLAFRFQRRNEFISIHL